MLGVKNPYQNSLLFLYTFNITSFSLPVYKSVSILSVKTLTVQQLCFNGLYISLEVYSTVIASAANFSSSGYIASVVYRYISPLIKLSCTSLKSE